MPLILADNSPSPPPSLTAPANVPPMDAAAHLQHRLDSQWDNLLNALNSGHFYIELILIALAFGFACLTANYIRRKIENRLAISPPQHIDIEFITKPIRLLGVLMTLPFLWVVQSVVTQLGIGGNFTGGVLELCYAYLLTKCVLMAIRQKPVAWLIAAAIIINAFLRAVRVARSVSAWLDSMAFDAGHYHITALHLVYGFVIFVVVFWGAGVLSSLLESYLRRSTRLSPNSRHLTIKLFKVFVYISAIALTFSAIGIDLTAFAIFSGALGVGIGLGLQKMTSNFVSGVTMLMERSIKIGDLIEVGGYTGWVRQLHMRYVLLETSDGREIIIPNEELISTRVTNWTLSTPMARIEIKTTIAFDSDPEKARNLMLEAAREHPRCLKDPAAACFLKEFAGNGLVFTLSFWISDVKEGRNGPQSDVMFSVLKKFNQNGIVLAKA